MTARFEFTIYNLFFKLPPAEHFTIKFLIISLLAFVCTLYIVHFTFLTPASAQTPSAVTVATSSSTSGEPKLTPEVSQTIPSYIPPTSPLYTDLLVNNLFHSFSCLAIGQSMIGQPCLTYKVTKNAQGALQGIPVLSQVNLSGGALGSVTSVIGALYLNPPVRTADYLASVGTGLGIVKEANAQVVGSGAAVLSPILSLWQVSRNVSYVIMIIIFVVIGLMVMFRNKLNPQTVITAQAALPGLVIGLILITFSYFLAGLISDMAFVGTNVVGYYFVAAQGRLDDPQFKDQLNLTQKISQSSILDILAPLTGIVTRERADDAANRFVSQLGDAIWPIRIAIFFLSAQFLMPIAGGIPPPFGLIAAPIVSLFGGAVANIGLPFFLGYFLSFAAALALTYQMIKLLIKLIMAYLTIIFLTISAPFQFLFASLPGRQGIATGWIMNMLGNILIFPAVVAVIYFVAFLLGPELMAPHCPQATCPFKVSNLNQESNIALVSPVYAQGANEIIGNSSFPLLGGMDLNFVKILLAFGALMALPTIPDIITRAIGKGGQAGSMIGQEIMGGFREGQGYAQRTYMGGLNYAQGAKTSIFGEKQFSRNPTTGRWAATYGKPGAVHWGQIERGQTDADMTEGTKAGTQALGS